MKTDPTITDPRHPAYWPEARDRIMDLCPFYDPNHKCGIVREHVFKDCLNELREREQVALEKLRLVESGKNWWHGAIESATGPAFESPREADEKADGKPDGQEENAKSDAPT